MFLNSEFFYFKCIASFLNLSQAADHLGVQQSALSKSLKKLENKLDKKLFVRLHRGLKLTSDGSALLNSINKIEVLCSEELKLLSSSSEHTIRMGSHPSIAISYLPLFFKEYKKHYPSERIQQEFANSLIVTKQVNDAQLDCGIVANPIKNANIVARLLEVENVALFGHSKLEQVKYIFYHPDMISIRNIIKKIPSQNANIDFISIANYECIAALCQDNKDSLGILPEKIAKKLFQLEKQSKNLAVHKICLIYRTDSIFIKNFKKMNLNY